MNWKKFIYGLWMVVLFVSCSDNTTIKINEFDIDGDVTAWNDNGDDKEIEIDQTFFFVKNSVIQFVEEDGKLMVDVIIVRGNASLPKGNLEEGEGIVAVYGKINEDERLEVNFTLKDKAQLSMLYEMTQGEEMHLLFSVDEKDLNKYKELTQNSFVKNVKTDYAELWLSFDIAISGNAETTVVAGNDWDELLDDYEQYIDSYIACMKKVSNGDMSAMSEYATLLEKANSMNEKIANIQDELSSSQLQRYMKLCEKLLNAASNM